nr:MAG TPA: hypothetical protein [Caudoviricetes sp.]
MSKTRWAVVLGAGIVFPPLEKGEALGLPLVSLLSSSCGGGHIDALALGVQHKAAVDIAALDHITIHAHGVLVNAVVLQLHHVHGRALVLQNEVGSGREDGGRNGHHVHAVDGAAVAAPDVLSSQGVRAAHDHVSQLELKEGQFRDEQDAARGGDFLVGHGGVGREDLLHDVGLGQYTVLRGQNSLASGQAVASDPLLEAVLVDFRGDDLVDLTLEALVCLLDVELLGGVTGVDGESERLVHLQGHFLGGVAQLGQSAETGGAGAGVVGGRHGVHGVDFDRLDAREFVVVSAVTVGLGADGEALLNFLRIFFSKIDSHRGSLSFPAPMNRGLSVVPGIPVIVNGVSLFLGVPSRLLAAGGTLFVVQILLGSLQLAFQLLVFCCQVFGCESCVGRNQTFPFSKHRLPNLLGDIAHLHIGERTLKRGVVRVNALFLFQLCLLFSLRVLPLCVKCLPLSVQFHALKSNALVDALSARQQFRSCGVHQVFNAHVAGRCQLSQEAFQLCHALFCRVAFAAHMVIVQALLCQDGSFFTIHLRDLAESLEFHEGLVFPFLRLFALLLVRSALLPFLRFLFLRLVCFWFGFLGGRFLRSFARFVCLHVA